MPLTIDSLRQLGVDEEQAAAIAEALENDRRAEREAAAKREAYRELLRRTGVSERRLDAVLRVSDTDGLTLTPEGRLAGEDELAENVRREWSDFIVTAAERGVAAPRPPQAGASDLDSLSDADFYRAVYKARKF